MNNRIEDIKNLIIEMSEKADMKWLFDTHTAKVAKKAQWLLEKFPEANEEVVMLSVWLHDIYYLIDISKESEHAALGAAEASKILKGKGFSDNIIDGVGHAVRAHSCKDVKPESIEAKILATADAMSHFTPEFYLGIAMFGQASGNQDMKAYLSWARKKVERDMDGGKIHFDFAKEAIEDDYIKIKAFLNIGVN